MYFSLSASPATVDETIAVLQPIAPEELTSRTVTTAQVLEELASDDEDGNGEVDIARLSRKGQSSAVKRPARRLQQKLPGRAAAIAPATAERCDSMNFFARAICKNYECARPELLHASSCDEARRQRLIYEARRNPTLAG